MIDTAAARGQLDRDVTSAITCLSRDLRDTIETAQLALASIDHAEAMGDPRLISFNTAQNVANRADEAARAAERLRALTHAIDVLGAIDQT
jgi:hypothetical protein